MTEPVVPQVNGWNKWSLHIQKELERLATEGAKRDELIQALRIEEAVSQTTNEALKKALTQNTKALNNLTHTLLPAIQSSITSLKVKAGLWGAVAGAIPTTVAIIYGLVTSTP